MPSGRTHDRITMTCLPIITVGTLSLTQDSGLTFWVAAGFLFGGWMLGPDLDTHSVHYKRWGWLRWIWLPYRGQVKHRSPLSHGPIIGTVVRVLYLLLWIIVLGLVSIAIANQVGQIGWTWQDLGRWVNWIRQYSREGLAIVIGLELGACSHYLADRIGSAHKRLKRSRRSPRSPSRPKPKSSSLTLPTLDRSNTTGSDQ